MANKKRMVKPEIPADVLEWFKERASEGGKAKVPKGFSMLTPDERRELASKAGRASAAKRKAGRP